MMVTERVQLHDFYDSTSCSLKQSVQYMQRLAEMYGESAVLQFIPMWDNPYDVVITYKRQETENEREKRLAKVKKNKEERAKDEAKRKERELAELARLKAKYEK